MKYILAAVEDRSVIRKKKRAQIGTEDPEAEIKDENALEW